MTTEEAPVEQRYAGRTVLVTGAAAGIGRAVALRLGAEGAAVACLDLDGEGAARTAGELALKGGRAISGRCDVSRWTEVEAAVARVEAELGPCDVAANVAGIGWFAHSHEEDPDRFARAIAVNLTGTFHVCRAVLPAMVARASGVIVNTASNSGLLGAPWSAAYGASKGGVVQLTRCLATEYLGGGIRVVAVAPGGVNTDIHNSFAPPEGADWKRLRKIMTPLGMAEPDELAGLFAYVASDEARYMTGSIVTMDGGITA
jgi:NAD(P)-dependent dehydrogenase (short-subunit alcohol dehydrogenase family)